MAGTIATANPLPSEAAPQGIIDRMPSPVGHALGGIAAGWLVEPRGPRPANRGSARRSPLPLWQWLPISISWPAAIADPPIALARRCSWAWWSGLSCGNTPRVPRASRSPAPPPTALTCCSTSAAPTRLSHMGSRRCGPSRRRPSKARGRSSSRSRDAIVSPICSGSRTSWRCFGKCSFWPPWWLWLRTRADAGVPPAGSWQASYSWPPARRRSLRRRCPAQTAGSERYAAAVSSYCAGRFEDAVRAATDMSEELIRDALKDLRKDVRTQQCAVMLHTEVAFSFPVRGPTTAWQFHVARARQQLAELRRVRESSEFERQWYLFVSSALQADQDLDQVHAHLVQARERFPRDADVLVWSGAEYELYALWRRVRCRAPCRAPGTSWSARRSRSRTGRRRSTGHSSS